MKIPSHLRGIATHSIALLPADRKRGRTEEEGACTSTSRESDAPPPVHDEDVESVGGMIDDMCQSIQSACSNSSSSSNWLVDLRKVVMPSGSAWIHLWESLHNCFHNVNVCKNSTGVDSGTASASPSHRIVAFELEGSKFGGDGVATLVDAFRSYFTSTFQHVSCWFLASSKMSSRDMRLLLKSWGEFPGYGSKITIVGLTNNPIVSDGDNCDATLFADLSALLTHVERLHANHVGLTAAIWKEWLPHLSTSSRSLKHLWLKQNPGLDAAQVLADVAPYPLLARAVVV